NTDLNLVVAVALTQNSARTLFDVNHAPRHIKVPLSDGAALNVTASAERLRGTYDHADLTGVDRVVQHGLGALARRVLGEGDLTRVDTASDGLLAERFVQVEAVVAIAQVAEDMLYRALLRRVVVDASNL